MTNVERTQVSAVAVQDGRSEGSYVDWPAIFAGAVVGSAISLLFLAFGSALGLSMTSAYKGSGMSLAAFAISAALWLIWVQVSGFFAGGYLTGRMRRRMYDASEHESDVRDGSHGVIVWSLGLLIGAMITMSGVSSTISGATKAVTSVAGAAAGGAAAGMASNANPVEDVLGLSVDRFLRPAPADAGTAAATTPAAKPGDPSAKTAARAEILRILGPAIVSGELDQADRAYLADMVAAQSGIPKDQAAARVDQLWTQATAAEQKVRDAADRARKLAVIGAFITAVSLLISGVAAYAGAVLGGNHRDNNHVVLGWTRPW